MKHVLKESPQSELVAKGIKGRVTLPRIPLDYMFDIPFEILRALAKEGGSVRSISDLVLLVRADLSRMEPAEKHKVIRSEQARIASQMEGLRQLRYVDVRPEGRKKRIVLTELGRTVLGYQD